MFVNSQQKVPDEAACLCHSGTSFPTIDHPRTDKSSLGYVMSLDTQLTTLLVGIRACPLCSNDDRLIQNALLALKEMLLLVEAEQRVYTPPTRNESSGDRCSSSDRSDGSPRAPGNAVKEQFNFGNIALDDTESTVIARRLIRDAAIRIGQNLRWIGMKRKAGIIGSSNHQRSDQEIELAMDRVKIIVARTSLHFY